QTLGAYSMRAVVVCPAQSDSQLRFTYPTDEQSHGGIEHREINALHIHVCEPGRHVSEPVLTQGATQVTVPVLQGIERCDPALKAFGQVWTNEIVKIHEMAIGINYACVAEHRAPPSA